MEAGLNALPGWRSRNRRTAPRRGRRSFLAGLAYRGSSGRVSNGPDRHTSAL